MDANKKIHPYAKSFIECKARQLIGKCGIRSQDVEDVEQELYLDLSKRMPRYDPGKSKITTFIQRVVENKIANILRERCAKKNLAFINARSLEEAVGVNGNGSEVTLGDAIDSDRFERRQRGRSRTRQEERELKSDARDVMGILPKELRIACQLLLNGTPVSNAAKQTGFKRSTFYDRVVVRLREAFRETGMEDYLLISDNCPV